MGGYLQQTHSILFLPKSGLSEFRYALETTVSRFAHTSLEDWDYIACVGREEAEILLHSTHNPLPAQ